MAGDIAVAGVQMRCARMQDQTNGLPWRLAVDESGAHAVSPELQSQLPDGRVRHRLWQTRELEVQSARRKVYITCSRREDGADEVGLVVARSGDTKHGDWGIAGVREV